jgi:hypothetical protein
MAKVVETVMVGVWISLLYVRNNMHTRLHFRFLL